MLTGYDKAIAPLIAGGLAALGAHFGLPFLADPSMSAGVTGILSGLMTYLVANKS